jgi:hypothetical protein
VKDSHTHDTLHESGFTASTRSGISLSLGLAFVVVMFLVAFPKGGFKVGGAPITWGYLLLMGVAPLVLLVYGLGGHLRFSRVRLLAVFAGLPLAALTMLGMINEGPEFSPIVVGYLLSSFVLPFLLTFALGPFIDQSPNIPRLLGFLRSCIFAVAVYGIVLFVYFALTGATFEVPYLTVNGSDVETLTKKHNMRGEYLKLVATYNNGNIYGVSTLILFPLYLQLEKRTWRIMVVRFALILTLSRTVWIGLLLAEILNAVVVKRANLASVILLFARLLVVGAGLFIALQLMDRSVQWMADPNLGGREHQLRALDNPELVSGGRITVFAEMTYMYVLGQLGLAGLLAFLLLLATPLLAFFMRPPPDSIARACICGCAVYWVCAFFDGAYIYIPVMAFYWLATSLALSSNPMLDEMRIGERC